MTNTSFKGNIGTIKFDQNGDLKDSSYHIMNLIEESPQRTCLEGGGIMEKRGTQSGNGSLAWQHYGHACRCGHP